MAIELVTGHAGQGHVSSADAGRLNAGICGAGKYVLDTGLKFAYSIESANLIRIASGDAVNQGRHITIPQNTYEDANILNGTQGKTRIDVITLRYSKVTRQVDSQTVTVEEASVNVIKGTEVPTGSTPEAPAVVSGNIFNGTTTDDMPLYHVLITDTSVTSVTPVFTTLKNIREINQKIGSENMGTTATTVTGAIKEIITKIGSTAMGTTATTVTGAIKEIITKIGSTAMGTTATTVTGAIKEHQDVLDDFYNKKAWKLIQDTDILGGINVEVPDDAKEIYIAVYVIWSSTEKVCVDFHIPVMGHLFNPSSGAAITYHTNYWSFGTGPTGKYGVVQIQTSRDNSHYYAKLHAAYSATADVTSSTYCRMFYR